MSFWSWIKGTAAKLKDKIVALVKSQPVQDLLKDELGKIVRAVVAELSNASELTSSQKREAAFARVIAEAMKAGVDFSHAAVNLLIELAVAELKARAV